MNRKVMLLTFTLITSILVLCLGAVSWENKELEEQVDAMRAKEAKCLLYEWDDSELRVLEKSIDNLNTDLDSIEKELDTLDPGVVHPLFPGGLEFDEQGEESQKEINFRWRRSKPQMMDPFEENPCEKQPEDVRCLARR